MGKLSEVGYNKNRKSIESAYTKYINKEDGAEGDLFQAVLKFAESKLTSSLYNEDELAVTSEDHAQDVVIKVWEKLPTFVGDTQGFYSWISRICYTHGADAINDSRKQNSKKVPLFTESEDELGLLEDNPLIYRNNDKVNYIRPLPEFIQGVDREICNYIRNGYSYARIGELYGMTEDTVKQRVNRMKKKVEKEKKNAKG